MEVPGDSVDAVPGDRTAADGDNGGPQSSVDVRALSTVSRPLSDPEATDRLGDAGGGHPRTGEYIFTGPVDKSKTPSVSDVISIRFCEERKYTL